MDKATVRQETIHALATMSATQRQTASTQLYAALFALPAWQRAHTVATTLSSELELATQPIIAAARAAGKVVAVPQTLPRRQMAFHELTDQTTLATTKFGLQEPQDGQIIAPEDFDLLVVPGLQYTPAGERLGFGGGYYDRYLTRTTGFKVALALPAQYVPQATWQVEEFDVQLDAVLTTNLK